MSNNQNEFMILAVNQVLDEMRDERTMFERIIDDASAAYGVKAEDLVQAVNFVLADDDGQGAFRSI